MQKIKIETVVNAPIEKVWGYWNEPEHITKWAFASDDWECPYAENDLREGGKSLVRMAAKDSSSSFDIVSTYTTVVPNKKIEYTMADGRTVSIDFDEDESGKVKIVEEFEMENQNSEEMQRSGWQAILDNFKKYTEEN
jgi:uncharacterized protein YndB with AHSA1/START domain